MIQRRALLVALVGAAAVTGLAVASASSTQVNHDRSGLTRADVADYLSTSPGVPLALPRDMRPDLIWLGPESTDRQDDGPVTIRSSTFTRRQMASGPTVSLCVESPTPESTCPDGGRTVRRQLSSGERVMIAFYGASASTQELDWWRTVPLEYVDLPDWVQ